MSNVNRRLDMPLLIVLVGLGLSLVHAAMMASNFDALPDRIPAFVNMSGHPIVTMPKSSLSEARGVLMALVAQGACLVMYALRLPAPQAEKANRQLWSAVALIVAAKMMLESLSLLGSTASWRWAVVAVSLAGVALLLPSAFRLVSHFNAKTPIEPATVSRAQRFALATFGAAYLLLVVMPWWLPLLSG